MGGVSAAARNVISGNNTGVTIKGGAFFNFLVGNYIGIGPDGVSQVPNSVGVLITSGAFGNAVGEGATTRNIISGNEEAGIEMVDTGANWVVGNYVGLDASGSIPVGNKIGILLNNASSVDIGPFPIAFVYRRVAQPVGDPNVISGNASLTFDPDNGNVISGNTEVGIEIVGSGSTGERIWGNLIGPDASGDRALPPAAMGDPTQAAQQTGIEINGATGNTIGGSGEPMNVISGNAVGVEFTEILAGSSVPSDTLINNVIGLGLDGNTLGNVIGVWVNDVPEYADRLCPDLRTTSRATRNPASTSSGATPAGILSRAT